MLIRDVDFPQPLLDAQQNRSLVVFAGAGVSMPPPSNYPDFDRLAEQVSDEVLTRQDREPIDRFLGRLAARKVKVHERVSTILSNPTSAPNPLHSNLLRLFETGAKARLVTTNFDLHFTTAARTVFSPDPGFETYSAPAVPLGGEFYGVVYLHGSVDKPADRLVLTDADFGRAYLTEGWAARFLQRVFAQYVVLFVGYSHRDPVMTYLARGLPPGSEGPGRFALTVEGDDDHWTFLGIRPITYRLTHDQNEHSALGVALAAWADRANSGALEQEQKIKGIVELPFPLNPEDSDYIENALRTISTTRFFTRHAKSLDWLRWTETKGILAPLFRPSAPIDEVGAALASWFAENFVCETAGAAFAVMQRQGQHLNPVLWNVIAHHLFRWLKTPHRDPDILARWTPLLINSRPCPGWAQMLEYILNEMNFPEDKTPAVLLFDYLTKPSVLLKEDIWGSLKNDGEGEDADIELRTEGGDYLLMNKWRRFFQPNLATFADELLWILTAHLQEAHLLLRSSGKADEKLDPLSLSRGSIESSYQAGRRDGIATLIDAARDTLEWNLANRHATADSLIEMWFSSDSHLLKRLAIFGVAKSAHWESNEKINWLLEHNLLYVLGLKHEVFLVLKEAYQGATEESKIALLERVSKGPDINPDGLSEHYAVYNLLYWLHTAAPDCPLAKARFTEYAARYPQFGPRDRPDLDVVIGPVQYGSPSPLTTPEILSKDPEELIEFVATFKPQHPFGPDIHGLIGAVTEAVVQSYDWGMRVARALQTKESWKSDLWKGVVDGWKHTQLTTTQWEEVLGFLNKNDQLLGSVRHEVSSLLENGIKAPSHQIPASTLHLSISVAEKLWSICASSEEGIRDKADDWLFVAINHPAGTLAEFVLYVISNARKESGDNWKGIPTEYQRFLTAVLTGKSHSAELGRVILASRIHFLFSSDKAWTVGNVVPLLDWPNNSRQALQAWHAYLTFGTWDDDLLAHLVPYYEQAFPVLHSEFGRFRQRFCEHLAGIACFSSINPITHGWLNRFLLAVGQEERVTWASYLYQMLKSMKEPAKRNAWDGWINSYWKKRISGVPAPLDGIEVAEMVRWTPELDGAFPEAVLRIIESPKPIWGDAFSDFIYDELAGTDYPDRCPGLTAKLVLHLLRSGLGSHFAFGSVEGIAKRAAVARAEKRDLLDICDQLARLGYTQASNLRNAIEVSLQSSPPVV
jgi:hypothetical protein